MARARSLKPGFFTNEDLIDLPFEYRLLFAGLWTLADREGRLEDRPKRIKLSIFPGDDVDVEAGLVALAARNFIIRYEVGGARYIQIVAWGKHQSPHIKEAKSTIPAPCKPDAGTGAAALTPSSLTPDSPFSDSLPPDTQARVAFPGLVERETAAGKLAADLIAQNVIVTSIHPTLLAWLQDGIARERIFEAIPIAAKQKQGEPIPANYLDRIIRAPQRAPPSDALSKLKWRPPPDDESDRVPN